MGTRGQTFAQLVQKLCAMLLRNELRSDRKRRRGLAPLPVELDAVLDPVLHLSARAHVPPDLPWKEGHPCWRRAELASLTPSSGPEAHHWGAAPPPRRRCCEGQDPCPWSRSAGAHGHLERAAAGAQAAAADAATAQLLLRPSSRLLLPGLLIAAPPIAAAAALSFRACGSISSGPAAVWKC